MKQLPEKAFRGITTSDLCADWRRTNGGNIITVKRAPIISRNSRVMCIGSCFAREIRHVLRLQGFDVYPKLHEIDFDRKTQALGDLPKRDNIHHYSAQTICQEITHWLGEWSLTKDDFWYVDGRWHEPIRRNIHGETLESIIDLSDKTYRCMAEGFEAADVVILTLGLTETWRINSTGLFTEWNSKKQPDAESTITFSPSGFDATRQAMLDIVKALGARKIVVTVSPVPLRWTFTGNDIVQANMVSKTTQRAVLAEIQADNVFYWPSYEWIAGDLRLYEDDYTHIRRDVVEKIIEAFIWAHVE